VPTNGPNQKYATLNAFRQVVNPAGTTAATGFEGNSTEISNQPLANLFANPAAQDFRLKDCATSWVLPAADQVTSDVVVAVAKGLAAAFSFTPAEFRAALGLPANAPLRLGGLQQLVSCAGFPLASAGAAATAPLLELYPNPARHELHLRLASERADQATVVLHNSLGQEVLRLTRPVGANGSLRVPVGQLAAGAYWATLHLQSSGQRSTKAVSIQQ
jgi:hypothetical protein